MSPKTPLSSRSTEKGLSIAKFRQKSSTVLQLLQIINEPLSRNRYLPKNGSSNDHSFQGLIRDLRSLGFKDVETLLTVFVSKKVGIQDDSKLLLENMIQLLSGLDPEAHISRHLTAGIVGNLWRSLPHPSTSTMDARYRFRTADGSFNNLLNPDLGKAGSAYARRTKPVVFHNIALPDPGELFDTLLTRKKFERHPSGISSMFFYFATLIVHDIFRTNHQDFTKTMTSSYLELSPLYGSNEIEQSGVRTFQDGKLKPDSFSEQRLLSFPPGVGLILIMFNRFHNHVATTLARINELGRFTKPQKPEDEGLWQEYDENLFQTSRLITCGLYVNCILKDYVRTILSLNRTDSKWDLDPRIPGESSHSQIPLGVGNQVAAEFNLVYRWHSVLSEKDAAWMQQKISKINPSKRPEKLTVEEFLAGARRLQHATPEDPLQREFSNLQREATTSKFADDDLVNILTSSISDVAGAFGTNHTPSALRAIEILGIIQSRAWGISTLNEFRTSVGLAKHETFESINPNPEVVEKLRRLYDHPDHVEMYPGIIIEKSKPPMTPGSGLCVNYTISWAILSDAVSLVRGDRFYTTDYTPRNLTNWGYNEVNFDKSVNDGCVFYKLILRAFPDHFKGNSIFAHYPFVVPAENLKIQRSLNRGGKYSWEAPTRKVKVIAIKSHSACKRILEDKVNWWVTWGGAINFLVERRSNHRFGREFCLSGDDQVNLLSRELILKAFYPVEWETEVSKFYGEVTTQLLEFYSYTLGSDGRTLGVDIVRDVANLANARFAASVFNLPIKLAEQPRGVYTEQELYQIFSTIFISIFFDGDVTKSFQIDEKAREMAQQLGELVYLNVRAVAATGIMAGVFQKLRRPNALPSYGIHMIQRLLESDMALEDIVWSQLMPLAASMTANQSQTFSQSLDFYLGEGQEHIPTIHKLTQQNTREADEKIMKYFLEGARLRGTAGTYRDYQPIGERTPITFTENGSEVTIQPGDRVCCELSTASRDPLAFPDPLVVKLDRPLDSYINYGIGPHTCVGRPASIVGMTAMFKVVFGLKGLRRAKGCGKDGAWYGHSQGEMKSVDGPHGTKLYMTSDWSSFSPFPTTMKVEWDL